MKLHPFVFLTALVFGTIGEIHAEESRPLNVLMIAIDDMRPELGCYGVDHIISPNIDRLASEGRQFNRAYCQQAVCNPSRSSLMTGQRPDAIGVTGNHVYFRDNRPDIVTIPQYFKQRGYHSQSVGKIYHGFLPENSSKTVWDALGDPESWSVPTTRFGPRYYYTEDGIAQAKQAYIDMYQPEFVEPDDWTTKLVFGPMTEAPDVEDNVLHDGKVADSAIQMLRERRMDTHTPFFLAVGFIKPHTPFVAPKKYWDLYDPDSISIAAATEPRRDAPKYAGHRSGEVRRYTDQPNRGPFDEENQRRLRHGYYACISYVDAQVGRVIDELDALGLRESTVVLLFADHGWHLGEYGLWGKTTNYELDARAPLIVRTPTVQQPGTPTDALVEFIDFYPSLSELAGLPVPANLPGRSFAPLMQDPAQAWKEQAISQYPRGGNADLGGKTMGYTMRTQEWRYVEWIDRESGTIVDRELYDHTTDTSESINVAGHKKHRKLVQNLSEQLHGTLNREEH